MSTPGADQNGRDDSAGRLFVTQLFHEWLDAREAGLEPDVHALLGRAGDQAGELRQRIRVYETLESFGGDPPPRDEASKTRLGRFQLLRTLGEGGLGSVYLALDPELKREVALKVLRPGAEEGRGWILNEARSLARILHSNVVRVFEVQRIGPAHVVAMEHLSGPSLQQVIAELQELRRELDETTPLVKGAETSELRRCAVRLEPLSARVRLLMCLADALAHCHDRGILHRDVKPANVVLDDKGQARLIDFGLAHQSGPGDEETALDITQNLVASPAYMAPEQVETEQTGADPRTDQFSFGTLAYEFLTLEHPFAGEGRARTLDAIALANPLPLTKRVKTIPIDLDRIILHALQCRPEDRYSSMEGLREDLKAVLEQRPISLAQRSPFHSCWLWMRRHRRRVQFVALAIALVAIGLFARHVQRQLGERSALRKALASSIAVASKSSSPGTLYDEGKHLIAIRARARELAAGFPPMDVSQDLEAAQTALGESISRHALLAANTHPEGVPEYPLAEWLRCVSLVESDLATMGLPPELRAVSTLSLEPIGLEGAQMTTFRCRPAGLDFGSFGSMISELEVFELPAHPIPGRYRIVYSDPDTGRVLAERGLHLWRLWRPPMRVEIQPPDPVLFERAVQIPRLTFVAMPGLPIVENRSDSSGAAAGPGKHLLRLPAHRILSDYITWEEFETFLRETHQRLPPNADLALDGHRPQDPAWVTAEEAQAFASARGGRLPSTLELFHADREGILRLVPIPFEEQPRLEAPESRATASTRITWFKAGAEWVEDAGILSDPSVRHRLNLFQAGSPIEEESEPEGVFDIYPFGSFEGTGSKNIRLHQQAAPLEDGGQSRFQSGISFRLVFPSDSIEVYTHERE